jgi:general secretion pathway protein I
MRDIRIGKFIICNSKKTGFTLLEVMISLSIAAGLIIILLYTLNYHLGIAERQETITVATHLAKVKMFEMEKNPLVSSGHFQEPYSDYSFQTEVRVSSFPGMAEIDVVVKNAAEEIKLSKLIQHAE